jgi:hypothetical protein
VACRKGLNLSIPDQSLDLPFPALHKMSSKWYIPG